MQLSQRERLQAFLTDDGFDERLFIPLVDAGYVASMYGKTWRGDVSFADMMAAAEETGYTPIFFAPVDYGKTDPGLNFQEIECRHEATRITRRYRLDTPYGSLMRELIEEPGEFGVQETEAAVKSEKDLPAIIWWATQVVSGRCAEGIREQSAAARNTVGECGMLCMQVGQPFELMGYAPLSEIAPLYLLETDAYLEAVYAIEVAQRFLVELLCPAGIDLIWLGTPGTGLLSPQIMEEAVVPFSTRMVDWISECGGISYFHSCGVNHEFVSRGYYNRIHPDLFETLAGPPTGNITDLHWARQQIDPDIRTKGNMDLGLLRYGTPDQVAAAGRQILEQTAGTRHALGLSDCVFYGTPVENMRALVEVAREHNKV